MRPVALLGLVLGIVAMACVSTSLWAQGFQPGPGRNPLGPPQPEPFNAEGTIQAIAPGKLQMLTNTNQTWLVAIPPQTEVRARGTAVPEFLRPGQFVQFRADVDKQGGIPAPIAELTIFTPTRPDAVGVWPENAGHDGPAPGPAPFGSGMRLPGGAVQGDTVPCRIAGRLTLLREGKLAVQAGRGLLRGELAAQASIRVELADYALARVGDHVSVRGHVGRPGLAQATHLTVDLSQTLGAAPAPVQPEEQPRPDPRVPPQPPGQPQGELPK